MNRQDMSLEEKKVKLIVSVYIQSRSQVDATKLQDLRKTSYFHRGSGTKVKY